MASLAVLLCLFHILSFLMACLFIGVLSLVQMVSPRRCLPSLRSASDMGGVGYFPFPGIADRDGSSSGLDACRLVRSWTGGRPFGNSRRGEPVVFPEVSIKNVHGFVVFPDMGSGHLRRFRCLDFVDSDPQ